VYIYCKNDKFKKSLVDLREEILFLSKSNELIFDRANEQSTVGRLFEFKITNDCILYAYFTQKVDIQLEIKKIDDKINKFEREIGKLQDKLVKNDKFSDENRKIFQEKVTI
jgi:valyl-tRNA synthetase